MSEKTAVNCGLIFLLSDGQFEILCSFCKKTFSTAFFFSHVLENHERKKKVLRYYFGAKGNKLSIVHSEEVITPEPKIVLQTIEDNHLLTSPELSNNNIPEVPLKKPSKRKERSLSLVEPGNKNALPLAESLRKAVISNKGDKEDVSVKQHEDSRIDDNEVKYEKVNLCCSEDSKFLKEERLEIPSETIQISDIEGESYSLEEDKQVYFYRQQGEDNYYNFYKIDIRKHKIHTRMDKHNLNWFGAFDWRVVKSYRESYDGNGTDRNSEKDFKTEIEEVLNESEDILKKEPEESPMDISENNDFNENCIRMLNELLKKDEPTKLIQIEEFEEPPPPLLTLPIEKEKLDELVPSTNPGGIFTESEAAKVLELPSESDTMKLEPEDEMVEVFVQIEEEEEDSICAPSPDLKVVGVVSLSQHQAETDPKQEDVEAVSNEVISSMAEAQLTRLYTDPPKTGIHMKCKKRSRRKTDLAEEKGESLAEAQLERLQTDCSKTKNVRINGLKVLVRNIVDFLPVVDYLKRTYPVWYGDPYLTNICVQHLAIKYNFVNPLNVLKPHLIFIKYKIILQHWQMESYLYQNYKAKDDFIFKKFDYIRDRKENIFILTCGICGKHHNKRIHLKLCILGHLYSNECCFCNQMFDTEQSLRSHILAEHKDETAFSVTKKFKCHECSIYYLHEANFLKHIDEKHSNC